MYKKIILLLLLININSLSFANNSLDFSELTKLARTHWYQDPVIGIKYADKALKQAIEIKDTSLIFEAKILLGSLYLMAGNFDLALDVYLNAENYLDINDIPQIADYNIHLASMYFSLKDSSKSNEYNDIALNLYKKLNDSIGISWVYNLKGLVYYQDSLFNKSEEYLNKSLELNRQIGNIEGIYINYNNLSIIPGNEAERLKILNEALGYNIKKNYKWTEAENYNNFAVIYTRLKKYDEAKKYLKKSREISLEIGADIILRDNLEFLAKLAYEQRDYKLAYNTNLELNALNTKINSVDNIRRIEEDAFNRKTIDNLHKIELKDQALKIAQQEKFYLLLSGALLIFIILLLVRIYHLNKVNILNKRTEEEREKKNQVERVLEHTESILESKNEMLNISKKELTDLVYLIKSKDKLVDNILQMLQEAQKKNVDDPKVKIKSIILLIKNFKEKEHKSSLFTNEISKNEEEFLKKLNELHPDLSKNEITLITLLKAELSTKEIALLIDSNPKTINMARYRMRKKLNLETDDNLISYLKSL